MPPAEQVRCHYTRATKCFLENPETSPYGPHFRLTFYHLPEARRLAPDEYALGPIPDHVLAYDAPWALRDRQRRRRQEVRRKKELKEAREKKEKVEKERREIKETIKKEHAESFDRFIKIEDEELDKSFASFTKKHSLHNKYPLSPSPTPNSTPDPNTDTDYLHRCSTDTDCDLQYPPASELRRIIGRGCVCRLCQRQKKEIPYFR